MTAACWRKIKKEKACKWARVMDGEGCVHRYNAYEVDHGYRVVRGTHYTSREGAGK